ncbi:uncharacterized protein LOC135684653 [Rhopilema esculentum]|uniref:uncharacterized protein LOC135684653 n=1 Tax=Rhopilema esculentum TaxID=499914 RepID=UPI0031D2914B
MVNGNCAVIGCTNSRYKLKNWEKSSCDEHSGQPHKDCPCARPFTLHVFPSSKLNLEKRKEWTRLMRRTRKGNKEWTPGQSDMVCSRHFVDGRPTLANPNPSLDLGYDKPAKIPRRTLVRRAAEPQPSSSTACVADDDEHNRPRSDHEIFNVLESPCNEEGCQPYDSGTPSVKELMGKISAITKENNDLKVAVDKLSSELESCTLEKRQAKSLGMSADCIKIDRKMKFFTGIQTVKMFHALFSVLKPYMPNLVLWRRSKTIFSHKAKTHGQKRTKTHKLTKKDQFLLVLMRLRLGSLLDDLADRFKISSSSCSRIFCTWIRFLSTVLGGALISWLPSEVIQTNLPHAFNGAHSKTRCIIDCTEIYIERPKSLDDQAATWSDYKKHNTIKYLIGITPSGFISFVSNGYGGRATDQHICRDSGFYNLLEYGNEIMADRGFQIRDDLLHFYCTLYVPPGARVKSQMTERECKKTKEIANLRIHVERAINRIKTFRILKNTLPLTVLPFADDIMRTCAAICNIQPPLIKA